jgi:hypothetical protein
MRPIQNNLANLQINQIAMEQAAIQAAKNQQPARVRAEAAEEILKQQEQSEALQNQNTAPSQINPDGQKKKDPQSFKKLLYSKDGKTKTDSDETLPQTPSAPSIHHIDFKI